MISRWILGFMIMAWAVPAMVRAEEEVYVRGSEKPLKGNITKETPAGIDVGKEPVSSDRVLDVVYNDLKPITLRTASYKPAVKAEKDSLDPANESKRKTLIADAIKRYEETLKGADAAEKSAKRHLEFKLAMLAARQVREDQAGADTAITKLTAFKAKHKDAWQLASALTTLASLYAEQKKYAEAIDVYREIADNTAIAADSRHEAELAIVQSKIANGKAADAKSDLANLMKSLPENSPFNARARAAQAEVLTAEDKLDEAIKLARGIIRDSNDRNVKAIAHNTIGACLLKSGNAKEARWEFLWVDVVYNQDKREHAKALYHLGVIFTELGDGDKAQECFQTLINDRTYAGMVWVARAQEKLKAQQ